MRKTPYLEMDLTKLEANYRELCTALPGVNMHYAVKCNPELEVLKHLHSLGCKFEVASYPELEELMSIQVDPADVLFSNPVKMPAHIAAAHRAGLRRFAFDSEYELQKLAENAPGASVTVRLKFDDAMSEVPSEGKFGVRPEHAIQLMKKAKELGLKPYGAAFHVGTQMLDPGAWDSATVMAAGVMRELDSMGIRLKMLDIGGGFPAAYSDFTPDMKAFGAAVVSPLERHLPYPVYLAAEPGRALVASAGVMVATVIGLAERDGKRWVHVDVGAFNGMMEALESQNKLLFPVTTKRKGKKSLANLTGPSCDSQDTILFSTPLPEDLKIGDQLFIHAAGAYTTSYASTFNGFDIPSVHCKNVRVNVSAIPTV